MFSFFVFVITIVVLIEDEFLIFFNVKQLFVLSSWLIHLGINMLVDELIDISTNSDSPIECPIDWLVGLKPTGWRIGGLISSLNHSLID